MLVWASCVCVCMCQQKEAFSYTFFAFLRSFKNFIHSSSIHFFHSPSSLLSLVNPLIINLRISSKRPISLIYCNSYMNYIPSCGSIESCARKSFVDILDVMKLLKIFFTVYIPYQFYSKYILAPMYIFRFLLFLVRI